MTDYAKLYRDSEDFKNFVDKCAKADGMSVEEEFKKLTVRNVGDYYIERGEVKHPVTTVTNCGGGC